MISRKMSEIGEIKRGHKNNKTNLYIWHACVYCGKQRWVKLVNDKPQRTRCSSCESIARNWKGGRTTDKKGYVHIHLEPDDFFYSMANPHNNYVAEHRLVMAKHLKRCLLPWEVVHHKNGAKDDNRLDNLQLMSNPAYHTVDCLMRREIGKLQHRVTSLEKKVLLLEAENILLRSMPQTEIRD